MIAATGDPSFVYRLRREVVLASVHLGETVYAPGQRLPPHSHGRPVVTLFLEGSAAHSVDNSTHPVGPGQVIFVPRSRIHAYTFAAEIGRVFSVELDQTVCDGVSLPLDPIQTSVPALVATLLAVYRTFASDERVDTQRLVRRVVEALRRLQTERKRLEASYAAGAWLARALALVSDAAPCGIRISSIAHDVGRHPAHMSRRFRQVFGQSMLELRERRRLEAASRALLSQPVSIGTIAAELGFSDQAHLTRSFRRATQMTPLEFRRVLTDTSLPERLRRDLQSPRTFIFRPPSAANVRLASSDR